jgi:hypothetical protein
LQSQYAPHRDFTMGFNPMFESSIQEPETGSQQQFP